MTASLPPGIEALITDLRPRSQFSLEEGIRVFGRDGVGALLLFQIPTGIGKPPEVFLSTAPSSLVAELYKFS